MIRVVPLLCPLLLAFSPQDPTFETRQLATIPKGYKLQFEPVISDDGSTCAYSVSKGGGKLVYVGKKRGPRYANLHIPVLSPDGKRVAYWASQNGKYFVVIDGKKGPACEWVGNPIFSSDGKQVAYPAFKGKRTFVVLQSGRKRRIIDTGPYDKWRDPASRIPVFSLDGKRLACRAGDKESDWILLGKEKSRKHSLAGMPVFHPGGKRVAYTAMTGRGMSKWVLMDGDREIDLGEGVDFAFGALYSPDGKKVACRLMLGKKAVLSVDGKRTKEYDLVGEVAFVPGGSSVYFTAKKGRQWMLYKDDTAVSDAYDLVTVPTVSPDGKRVAYAAVTGAKPDKWGIIQGGEWRIIVGDDRSEAYDFVGTPVFNEKGTKVAFGARKGREIWWVSLDLK